MILEGIREWALPATGFPVTGIPGTAFRSTWLGVRRCLMQKGTIKIIEARQQQDPTRKHSTLQTDIVAVSTCRMLRLMALLHSFGNICWKETWKTCMNNYFFVFLLCTGIPVTGTPVSLPAKSPTPVKLGSKPRERYLRLAIWHTKLLIQEYEVVSQQKILRLNHFKQRSASNQKQNWQIDLREITAKPNCCGFDEIW